MLQINSMSVHRAVADVARCTHTCNTVRCTNQLTQYTYLEV